MGEAKRRGTFEERVQQAKIKPFYLITKKFDKEGLPQFDTSNLSENQKNYVDGCYKTFNKTKDKNRNCNFATLYWIDNQDFAATMCETDDADLAEQKFVEFFKDFNKSTFPEIKVGAEWTKEDLTAKGGSQAGMMFDLLGEGGHWPWPNANALFVKRGNKMIVEKILQEA